MKSKLFLLWSLITIALLAYAVYEAAFHAPMEKTMLEAQRAGGRAGRCRRRSGRCLLWRGACHRSHLGALCLGHILGVGRASHHHSSSMAALHELSDSPSQL